VSEKEEWVRERLDILLQIEEEKEVAVAI